MGAKSLYGLMSKIYVGAVCVSLHVYKVKGHDINIRRYTSSGVGGQPSRLILINKEVAECEFLVRAVPRYFPSTQVK